MSVLVISEVVRVFVNKGTTDHKYSLCNRKKLPQPIHLQLSKKHFFFSAYLKYKSKLMIAHVFSK